MTDDFDPTMRTREAAVPDPAVQPDAGDDASPFADDTRMTMTRSNADELVSPHDQPAEGGRDEVSDIAGADTEQEEPRAR